MRHRDIIAISVECILYSLLWKRVCVPARSDLSADRLLFVRGGPQAGHIYIARDIEGRPEAAKVYVTAANCAVLFKMSHLRSGFVACGKVSRATMVFSVTLTRNTEPQSQRQPDFDSLAAGGALSTNRF